MKIEDTDLNMSELTVVEFETSPHGGVYLSELSEGPPYTVHGVALGEGDITVGQSGIKKKWPAIELKKAADSLGGTNLVVDHNNGADGVVGRVTKSGFKKGTGVVYEAELYDEELAEKVKNGLLEVSIRGYHADVDSLEKDEDTDAKIVEDITFDNLSIVPTGASPSNSLEMGAHAELSAAQLSAFTDTLDEAELEEIEAGDWVTDGDMYGITTSMPEDGEIEVDLYEEDGDMWRSIEETKMVPLDSLEMWDVDEDNIGSAADKDSESDEEEAAANYSQGDWVKGESSGGMWYGKVKSTKTSGSYSDEIDGDVTINASEDNPAALIEIYQGSEASGEMVAHRFESIKSWDGPSSEEAISTSYDGHSQSNDMSNPDGMRKDSRNGVEPPRWEDGQMVQWQVNPAMKGKIVHIDREKKIIMVEVMENTEQGLQPTGFTVTAGYSDLNPMDRENAAVTTSNTPTQSASPSHDTSVKGLLDRYIESSGNESPSLKEFASWMEEENLSINRTEGEEEPLDSAQKLQDSRNTEPHRFIEAEDESSAELATRYDDYPEAASKNAQMALDAREETENPNDCGTDVGWKRANQLANGEGLTREQVGKMSAFNRHRSNSEQSDEEGRSDCGWMMWKAWGGDEGVDWAQRKLDQIEEENAYNDVPSDHIFATKEEAEEKAEDLGIEGAHEMNGRWMPGNTHEDYMDNVASTSGHMEGDGEDSTDEDNMEENRDSSDVESLQEYDMHTPSWSGTTSSDWSRPDMEDFDTDDLSEIADHFLISMTGFPPENYGDLKLPVVEPSGDLNVNALAAVKGGRGVSAVDGLSSEMEDEIVEWVNMTANEEFDKEWGMDEEQAGAESHSINGTAGRSTPGEPLGSGVRVLSGDDLWQSGKSKESDTDSLSKYKDTIMDTEIEEKLSELDEPVAVEATEVEELREKADRFEEMTESLEALRERTDILDSVDRSQVEELAEAEDAVVVESGRFEELTEEADQVKGVYAAQLAEEYDAFSAEELTDKFSIEELREKYEDNFGSVENLASGEAEPRSQDADEESLEEAAESETEDQSEEQLSDEISSKQEELKSKIVGGI